ncbi:hypothetical protein [Bradyrhizobium sp. BWA-3-5]|uniref:hypothetical protein n=1 Tax=Bradyrhizobium sp. BWA-3-5 TaxID=3080013 RepID=UPI00293F122D|nr:hypothetical protein [Bradyrhizobium sp. BWA-3-5]WOH69046.1 hypothetical protein RX331_15660 [Bradyrhizobium sp. BWA-3-5]
MALALLVIAALIAGIPRGNAAELWDFIRVGKSFVAGPKWQPRSGKAAIQMKDGRVDIQASYTDDLKDSAPGQLGYVSIKISGTLGSDGIVRATCTFPDTDASPIKLTGRYVTRDELQIWGEKRKLVTQREVVFSHPPNFEFFGFLKQDARDE